MSRANGALSDTALDREIDSALQVDHSPDLVARVRERVARESASTAASWVPAAAAVAGAAIVGGMLWLVQTPPDRAAADQPHTLSVARIASVPAAAPMLRSSTFAQPLEGRPKTPARANESAEVLISSDDATAIHRLLAFSRAHVVVLESVTADNRASAVEPLVIPPIVIEPLPLGSGNGERP